MKKTKSINFHTCMCQYTKVTLHIERTKEIIPFLLYHQEFKVSCPSTEFRKLREKEGKVAFELSISFTSIRSGAAIKHVM